MPELPEVEMYTRYFARHALGQPIAKVRVLDERILGDTRRATFVRELTGRTFRSARRHGKHLFADAKGPWLHLHFGMTGDLAYYRDEKDQPRFSKIVFDFRNGAHLAFEDMRLFGFAELSSDPETYVREHGLGPDPLDPKFRLREFRARLGNRRAAIKAVLLSQDVIAGVGNLYADETLFRAGIDPRRTIDGLSPDEIKAIYGHMRRVLNETIALKAADAGYPARFLLPHRGEDEPCPRCGGAILKTVVGGRTTYYCGSHQR